MTPPEHTGTPAKPELLELIGAVLNGTSTVAEQQRLNELLAQDPHARREYRRYINLHAALRSRFALTKSARAQPQARTVASISILPRGPMAWRLGAAAALLALVAGAALTFGPKQDVSSARQPGGAGALGRVSRESGARWGGAHSELSLDARLQPGSIDLTDGFAELTLASGVRVVLEAPVRFTLQNTGNVTLQIGRLVAFVPSTAHGFTIDTPHSRVVDLGTEFGVGVDDGGETEVQVFRGEVITQTKSSRGSPVDKHLLAGRALSIDANAAVRGIPFEPQRFVRMFPIENDPSQPAGPVYNRSLVAAVQVMPAPKNIILDGQLKDWDRRGSFHGACVPPYHDSHYVDGAMMYDSRFLYIGAHVGDPAPMLSQMDPDSDPQQYCWRGGSVIVRLATDPALGWPLKGMGAAEHCVQHPDFGRRPEDVDENIVHLTMWYHQPSGKARLQISYGMDFHGELTQPLSKHDAAGTNADGWDGVFLKDADGHGYTLEYAIPWTLMHANARPPRAGDVLAANWTVHWSDEKGALSRGHLVEITNQAAQPFRFLRGNTWGQAIFQGAEQAPAPAR